MSSQFGGHTGSATGFEHVHFATIRCCCGSNQTGVPGPSTDWIANGQSPAPVGKQPWFVTGVALTRICDCNRFTAGIASPDAAGTTFRLWSEHADGVELCFSIRRARSDASR